MDVRKRDFVAVYKQTVLGPLLVLHPAPSDNRRLHRRICGIAGLNTDEPRQ